jgi:hypothetical protein
MASSVGSEGPGEAGLATALARWSAGGDEGALARLLDRELAPSGLPRAWPVGSWWGHLAAIDAAATARGGWTDGVAARVEGLLRSALRFSRPGGGALFAPAGTATADAGAALGHRLAAAMSDPGLATVASRWWPRPGGRPPRVPAAPPLPSCALEGRPLAVLRADWNRDGDLLAIDDRDPAGPCRLHLIGGGRDLLGYTWTGLPDGPPGGESTVRRWSSHHHADHLEWSWAVPGEAVPRVRTAALLRGRKLALLGEEAHGEAPAGFALGRAPVAGAGAAAEADGAAVRLGTASRSFGAVVSLAFDAAGTGPLGLDVTPDAVRLVAPSAGGRTWRAALVSWEAIRNRKPRTVRRLTITEDRRICPPDRAVAFRVRWGQDDSLLIYRSLNGRAPRAVLGHQTTARFLVGLVSTDGSLATLLTVED